MNLKEAITFLYGIDDFCERIIDNTRKAVKKDGIDNLFVGYDKSGKDKTVLTVFRKEKDKIFAINMFENEEADRVYNLLTGGM